MADQFRNFLDKWQGVEDSKELLQDYLPLASQLLFADEATVRSVTKLLVRNITSWAEKRSPVYQELKGIVEKHHLADKDKWYVAGVDFAEMATSGTTSGFPFAYRRWNTALWDIEGTNHYDLILNEYNIPPEPHILYLLQNHNTDDFVRVYEAKDLIERHGISRKTTAHVISKTDRDQEKFYEDVLDYLTNHKIDVITISGQYLNLLLYHARRLNYKNKAATLLSNTAEYLLPGDENYCKQGFADYVCNHMRCWDGGAGFFTCKYGTYHLMDNLSYCWEDVGRLISTDYFSLASPFVNYWSGDLASISQDYRRCLCGRLFRQFEFRQSRPFMLKGHNVSKFRDNIEKLGIPVTALGCTANYIEVICGGNITEEEKTKVQGVFEGFPVNVRVDLLSGNSFGTPRVFGTKQNFQLFSSSGTFTVPAGKTQVQAEAWGGGGTGGGRALDANMVDPLSVVPHIFSLIPNPGGAGGGGGGGAYATGLIAGLTAGQTITVTVGTATKDSWFMTTGTVLAKGGSSANGTVGGAGGPASTSVGSTKWSGGTGANIASPSGGGGGSSASGGNNGNPGVGAIGGITPAPFNGGNGGNGGTTASSGTAGVSPGGGGGSMGTNAPFGSTNGVGATGQVIVSWT